MKLNISSCGNGWIVEAYYFSTDKKYLNEQLVFDRSDSTKLLSLVGLMLEKSFEPTEVKANEP